jgi:asparagine synthase (glutamine-hydrolysing)
MNQIIRHRGPDDEGYAIFSSDGGQAFGGADTPARVANTHQDWNPQSRLLDGEIPRGSLAFGHRRLAIIDLSPSGHQPMSYRSRFWIVFNGEVYNYKELRESLEHLGHIFETSSDTEVILAAYSQWGADCLSRFIGMWAFAIYDTEAQTLFLARDRFGIKPLYYSFLSDGLFVFGSEIKQFKALPAWQARLNGQRAYDYLAWSTTDHTRETMFEGVFQVSPASAGTFHLERLLGGRAGTPLDMYTWYELCVTPYEGDFASAAREFRDRFTDSLALHLRSDVPIGSCLSGGLDSSSIVCVTKELLRKENLQFRQLAFTASAEAPRLDETNWARIVVKATGAEQHTVCPTFADMFQTISKLVWHQDEPPGGPSVYAQWRVFELAARFGMKVMLDGQGSDEQLLGYHMAFSPYFCSLLRRGQLVQLAREFSAVRRLFGYGASWSLKMLMDSLLPSGLRQLARRYAGRAHNRPSWLDTVGLNARVDHPFDHLQRNSTNALTQYSIREFCGGHLQALLHWEDRASMAHSIEARVPFVEHRLAEFVISLPDHFKLHDGTSKFVMREAMKGLLPESIRQRRDKIGFATPDQEWLLERHSAEIIKRTAQAIESARGVLTPSALSYVQRMIEKPERYSHAPWRMIFFGEWMERFQVSF